MSKGLEAFYKIIDMAHEPNGYQNFTNACDTPYTKIVETALKALEIIKDKEMLSVYKDYKGTCYLAVNMMAFEIPQEEYELLKEVL